jgi:hypothetical protein
MLTLHSNGNAVIAGIQDRMRAIQPGGKVYEAAMQEAADGQHQACVQRIHVMGKASDGSDIGQYSTAPMYVNPKNSPGSFQPMGKAGKDTFTSTGKPHLTKYFEQGYRQYREETGLSSDKVLLVLRGGLRDGIKVKSVSQGYTLCWDSEELSQLADALEKKYGKAIWAATHTERLEILRIIAKQMRQALSKG